MDLTWTLFSYMMVEADGGVWGKEEGGGDGKEEGGDLEDGGGGRLAARGKGGRTATQGNRGRHNRSGHLSAATIGDWLYSLEEGKTTFLYPALYSKHLVLLQLTFVFFFMRIGI